MKMKSETLRDWIPIRVYWTDDVPFVDWCYMGNERFTEPFFTDTIQKRMRLPFNLLFRHQTSIAELLEIIDAARVVPPTGFIFHMSRCGSTLVAQMLAALSKNIVISEAPPVDTIIGSKADNTLRGQWFKAIVDAFGRRRADGERNYFIKFDSWNTLDLDFIARVFPDVPWIFLYRNPVEVIVSQMRQRGSQMVPGTMTRLLPGLSFEDALHIPAEEYCARILARMCSTALSHARDKNALLVNYDQLPGAVTGVIAEHFRVPFTPDECDQMEAAARFDAKTPQMTFEPDTLRKRGEASESIRTAAAIWVDPFYERLENIRCNMSI